MGQFGVRHIFLRKVAATIAATSLLVGCASGGASAPQLAQDSGALVRAADRLSVGPSPHTAIGLYQTVLEKDRKNVSALVGLARTLGRVGAYEQAARVYMEAAGLQPDNPEILRGLGMTYLALRDPMNAMTAFQKALDINPLDVGSLNGLALSHDLMGDYAVAQNYFARALDIDPGHRAVRANMGLSRALQTGDRDAAALLGDVARDPDATAKDRQNLALALALAGFDTEAMDVARLDLDERGVTRNMSTYKEMRGLSPDRRRQMVYGYTPNPSRDMARPANLHLPEQPVSETQHVLASILPKVAPERLLAQPTRSADTPRDLAAGNAMAGAGNGSDVTAAKPSADTLESKRTTAPATLANASAPRKQESTAAAETKSTAVLASAQQGNQPARDTEKPAGKAAAKPVAGTSTTDSGTTAGPAQLEKAPEAILLDLGAAQETSIVAAWQAAKQRYGDILAGLSPASLDAMSGAAHLAAGPVDNMSKAANLCVRVRARGGDCWIVPPGRTTAMTPASPKKPTDRAAGTTAPAAASAGAKARIQDTVAGPDQVRTGTPQAQHSLAKAGTYRVQLASVPSRADVEKAWFEATQKAGSVLAAQEAWVEPVHLGKYGDRLRLKVGPFETARSAQQFCRDLKAVRQQCLQTASTEADEIFIPDAQAQLNLIEQADVAASGRGTSVQQDSPVVTVPPKNFPNAQDGGEAAGRKDAAEQQTNNETKDALASN